MSSFLIRNMCGIAGYAGQKNAADILFDMLARLEYRGYDSAGIACVVGDSIVISKEKGKVSEVRKKINPEKIKSHVGVAHTRWATHGGPNQVNAHPHASPDKMFVVAHNGIIENYAEIKSELKEAGAVFASETDTEVVAHLLQRNYDGDLIEAFKKTLHKLRGSYALTALSARHPDRILIARNESPLLIGLAEGETYIASDAPAFLPYTKKAVFLSDGDYGVVTKDGVTLYSIKSGRTVKRPAEVLTWDVGAAEKGGYHHFMLKEINEEPEAARNALTEPKEISAIAKKIAGKKRVYFVACGTAYHAGLYAKYALEHFGIPSEAVVASEFRYSTLSTVDAECGVIAVSQSGETADTLAAVKGAKKKGAYVASVVNVVGSSLARESNDVAYTRSGPEIAVASTKAYIGQTTLLAALSLEIALEKNAVSKSDYERFMAELEKIPETIKIVLDANKVEEEAEKHATKTTFFFIGRRQNYPTALEGALKLKEISYVHAEGYPAGELKHGPLALLEPGVVVMTVLSADELAPKLASNIEEVRSRGASVVKVGYGGDLKTPQVSPVLAPIVNIVPLHLFAYYMSTLKGLDPDKPRNLAKSVTVE
ncbi:Glutamine--fructose-6-phosphate aminotransferase [isomerizing] [uncultured archaeon]|nr:Glutamine--fructose-6-phosphate aminotransferase [isomerizing] [uncultured archaeon]